MPTLDWTGKQNAVELAKKIPYRLLDFDSALSCGEKNSGNLIVQGDNLDALKSLLPYYRQSVKCIYIDPPYNTGSAFEHYDDNLEHSTWLSMMYPRLELLQQFLSDDGFFCCEIDDSEGQYLKVLCDEIFGRQNYLTTIYVQVRYPNKTLKEDMNFHKEIEQIHVYRNSPLATPKLNTSDSGFEKFVYEIEETEKPLTTFKLGGKKVEVFIKGQYKIRKNIGSKYGLKEIWATGTILDGNSSGRFFRDFLMGRYLDDGYGILYKVYGIGDDMFDYRYFTGPQRVGATKGKYYQGVPKDNFESEKTSRTLPIENFYDFAANFGNCRHEGGVDFRSGKKPEILIKIILERFSNEGDLVMDSFLGSGTTAAVAHKMNRRYIGIEMGEQAISHIVPRLQNVIEGEQSGISKSVDWQGGGGFDFYRVGEKIFEDSGRINPAVKFEQLAAYIWFKTTGTPYTEQKNSPLLGVHEGTAIYLLYNGILGDKRPDGGNVLTKKILALLPPHDGDKIIFGESCRISAENLKLRGITFKQTPKDILQ